MKPREAINTILEKALEVLKEDKFHASGLFVFKEKIECIVVFEVKDPDSNYRSMLAAGRKVAYLHPQCVAFVREAWGSRMISPKGKTAYDMPDREECLMITAQNKEGETASAVIPFSRFVGEIVLGVIDKTNYSESNLLDAFWDGVREGGR